MIVAVSMRKVLAALALLACIASANGAVVFKESGTESLVEGVLKAAADVHYFTIDTPGIYQASIADLALSDQSGFAEQFRLLQLAVKQLGPASVLFGKADLESPSFEFAVAAPGSFAALVKAVAGCEGFGFYEITISQVGPVPEPGNWLLMVAGLGVIGWRRILNRNVNHPAKL